MTEATTIVIDPTIKVKVAVAGSQGPAGPQGSQGPTGPVGPTSLAVFNAQAYGAQGTCTNNDPSTGVDDAPAVNAAIAAATIIFPFSSGRSATIYLPPLPSGRSYRFDSEVPLEGPIKVLGTPGASKGRGGTQITLKPGLRSAFCWHNAATSPNGGDGTGAIVEGVEVFCTPTVATIAYASNTTPATTSKIKPSNYPNVALFEVIRSGNLGPSAEPSGDEGTGWDNAHVVDLTSTWTPNTKKFHGNIVRSTDPAHWDVEFVVTTPIAGVQGMTGATEPAWDYTPGHTSSDNGMVLTCQTAISTLTLGAAIVRNVAMCGFLMIAPGSIIDCRVHNSQTAGVEIIGNAATIGSDAQGILLDRVEFVGCKTDIYVRGGGQKGLICRGYRGTGRAVGGLGPQALGTGGWDRNEHGIIDWSTQGKNVYIAPYSESHGGHDFWMGGGSGQAIIIGGDTNSGRVRLDVAALWIGTPQNFWSGSAGAAACTLGYGASSPAITNAGFKNAYQIVGAALYPAQYQFTLAGEPNQGFLAQTPQDSGFRALQYVSGWWTEIWASSAFASLKTSTRQVDHENGGNLWAPKGLYMGNAARLALFGDDQAYKDFGFRGGQRLVGDIVLRNATNAILGGAFAEIVTVTGYVGQDWQAFTFYTNYVAPNGLGSGYPGECITDSVSGLPYRVQPGGSGQSGGSRPNFGGLAPNPGNTLVDGSVTWVNVAPSPVLAKVGPIYDATQIYTQAMGDANQSVPADKVTRSVVQTTGALTQARTLTWNGATAGDRRTLDNQCTGGFAVKVAPATGDLSTNGVASGKSASIYFDGTNWRRASPDATP